MDPAGRFSLELPSGWRVLSDEAPLLEREALRARNTWTGAGFALQSWTREALLSARPRLERALDVDAVMSGDRIAALIQREQDAKTVGPTVYLGPADGVDSTLGRWVYLPPEQPRRVWWQVIWRSQDDIHQLVAWCPIEEFGRCALDFRELEGAVRRDWQPPTTVLFDSGQERCGAPLHADRARAMRASVRFDEARSLMRRALERYREAPSPPLPADAALRLAELSSSDALYRGAEACVHRAARDRRVCEVQEGPAADQADRDLQEAVVACMDEDPTMNEALNAAIAPYLGAP